MEIIKRPEPPKKAKVDTTPAPAAPSPTKSEAPAEAPAPVPAPARETVTLPKALPQRIAVPVAQAAPAEPQTIGLEPQQPTAPFTAQPPQQPYDDNIYMRDPQTGQIMKSELDNIEFEVLSADPLRAIWQGLCWAAESFKRLAMTTPALVALSPGTEQIIDQVATIGYQVTNTGAELARGLWNWPFTRVMVNEQLEAVIHPEEWKTFDRLYREYYEQLIAPVESGKSSYEPEKIKVWVEKHNEIADPKGFTRLCAERYTMDKIAQRAMWTPTDILKKETPPAGIRQRTTTGLERVFKKRVG